MAVPTPTPRRVSLSFVATLAMMASLMVSVSPFPSGAPQGTCATMVPHHGTAAPQDSSPPFGVAPARLRTEEGRVRLKLSSHQGVPFVGFLLQARDPSGSPIGSFTGLPDATVHLACGDFAKASATHNNATRKKSLDFEWEAPSDYEGPVVFNATVVQDFATFWVGITSDPVQVVKRSAGDEFNPPGSTAGPSATPDRTTKRVTPSTTPIPVTTQSGRKAGEPTDPIYEGCGVDKSCFGIPEGCVSTVDCRGVVSVVVRGERYEFEMKANDALYVAVGLSEDAKMGGDSVVECVPESGRVAAFTSWNIDDGKNNQRTEEQEGIKLINGSYVNGNIYCKFTRSPVTTVQNREFNLKTKQYHLLLAAGSGLRDNGVGYHDKFFQASGQKRSLADTAGFSADAKLFLRLHGAFMLTAWIGAASIGIVLARYYKQTWVGSRLCGKDQWFVWHRFCMVLVWLLTIAGFVLIFLELGGWTSDTKNPHAILGVVTTILCFIQPIGAAMRPTPSSPKRPIFNWLHWLIGNAAHIIAIVTIFFAPAQKAELPEWMDKVIVAFVAFYVFIHLILSISGCVSDRAGRKRVNSFPMKEMNSGRMISHSADRTLDAPYSGLRRFFLGVHIIVIILVTAALVLLVVFAPIEENFNRLLKTLNLA